MVAGLGLDCTEWDLDGLGWDDKDPGWVEWWWNNADFGGWAWKRWHGLRMFGWGGILFFGWDRIDRALDGFEWDGTNR